MFAYTGLKPDQMEKLAKEVSLFFYYFFFFPSSANIL